MKKSICILGYSFSLVFILCASSCRRETFLEDDVRKENYTVAVKFKEFDQVIHGMNTNLRAQRPRLNAGEALMRLNAVDDGYIYYWSFNERTIAPDIFAAPGATLTYNEGQVPVSFATGWSFDSYEAGFGVTITGANEIVLKMPLSGVSYIKDFALDIGSSGTGPKSFSLSYSQDGRQYTLLSEDNQFSNTNTAQAKNTFVFSLAELNLDRRRDLFLRLLPSAGFRGEAGDYRAATSVIKLDNIRLTGRKGTPGSASIQALHYYVFDAVSKDLVTAGEYNFAQESLADFSLSLPAGQYITSFVANESDERLILPAAPTFSSFFVGNRFSNYEARIFGLLDTFVVSGDMEREIALVRYFSQVKFEFTDPVDLSHVERIVVSRLHEPEFYAPFTPVMANPVVDQSEIFILPLFASGDKTISFNQFIGHVLQPFAVSYRVDVYGSNRLLRTFEVSSAIRNNVQLVFRGSLLEGAGNGSSFSIVFREDWDSQRVVDF